VSVLPLLVLAARRITEEELAELDRLVDELGDTPTAQEREAFQVAYWLKIGEATRNPLFAHQIRWWFHTLRGLRAATSMAMTTALVNTEIHRQLNASLRSRQGMMDTWMAMLGKLFDWTEAQPGHALKQGPVVRQRPQSKGRVRFPRARPARRTRR
jgi:DNA-binding GntR family transcriptional regulator